MIRPIFTWILIILLLITGTLLGLEIYGQNNFKPSTRFGVSKDNDTLALIEGQKNLKAQIEALDKKIEALGDGAAASNVGNNSLPVSTTDSQTNLPTSTTATTDSSNTALTNTLPAQTVGDMSQSNQSTTPSASQNNGLNSLFSNCVSQNGRDEAGFTATLKSNICILSGVNTRPDTFIINDEILEYQEGVSTGGKLKNSLGEVYNFTGSDTLFFTPETSKIGDKFKVSATVKNLNGIYTFQTFSRVEKVI